MKTPARTLSLAEATSWLSSLCQRIDAGEDLDPILDEFSKAQLATEAGVGRWILRLNVLEDMAKSAREKAQRWAAVAKRLEESHGSFEKRAIQIIADNPEIPFKSDVGALAVQRNSNPKLQLDFETREMRYAHVVSFRDLEELRIPPKYYTFVEALVYLNTDQIKADLKSGEFKETWARLEYGSHLRIK